MPARSGSAQDAGRDRVRKLADGLALRSAVLYVLGHVLDLVTTYLLAPDLRYETNVLVARFDLGWSYVLASAAATSLLMLAALLWMWRRLARRLPGAGAGYRRVYRAILYGTPYSPTRSEKLYGALLGLVCITAYAVITAKLLTCGWNLSVLAFGATVDHFEILLLAKNMLAAGVGLVMFFVFPYRLYRRVL